MEEKWASWGWILGRRTKYPCLKIGKLLIKVVWLQSRHHGCLIDRILYINRFSRWWFCGPAIYLRFRTNRPRNKTRFSLVKIWKSSSRLYIFKCTFDSANSWFVNFGRTGCSTDSSPSYGFTPNLVFIKKLYGFWQIDLGLGWHLALRLNHLHPLFILIHSKLPLAILSRFSPLLFPCFHGDANRSPRHVFTSESGKLLALARRVFEFIIDWSNLRCLDTSNPYTLSPINKEHLHLYSTFD